MLKIYITNLGKYNEGYLIGEWVSLPVSNEELEAVKTRIGINEQYEEMFITDYETDINGYKVGEYDDIETLNRIAELAEDDPNRVAALLYFGYDDPDQIADNIENVAYCTEPEGGESDDFAIGYYYAKELGCLDIPDDLEPYFDFEAYGRDIMLEGSFYTAESGAIYELVA